MNASFECIENHLYRRRRVVDAVLRYFHRLKKEAARVPAWIRSQDGVRRAQGVSGAQHSQRGFRCAGNSRKEKAWTAHPQALGELSEGAFYCHNAISHLKTARRVLPIIALHDLSRNGSQKFSNVDALESYFVWSVRVYLREEGGQRFVWSGIRTIGWFGKSQSIE